MIKFVSFSVILFLTSASADFNEDVFKAKVECPKGFDFNGANCEYITERAPVSKCPSKTVLKDGVCVGEVRIQPMLTCLENQQLVDGKCVYEEVTKAATACPKDFIFNGQQCIRSEMSKTRPQCPAGLKLSILKDSCVQEIKEKAQKICPEGSESLGNEKCSKLEVIPSISTCGKGFDFEDGKCIHYDVARANLKCAEGYKYEWGRCRAVTRVPKNSVCPSDYEFDGKKCVKVFVENISFVCDEGFLLKDNKCIKILEHEPRKVCRSQGYRLVENINNAQPDAKMKLPFNVRSKNENAFAARRTNKMPELTTGKEEDMEDFSMNVSHGGLDDEFDEEFAEVNLRKLYGPFFPYSEPRFLIVQGGSTPPPAIRSARGGVTARNTGTRIDMLPNVPTYGSNRRANTALGVDNVVENVVDNVRYMGDVIRPVTSALRIDNLSESLNSFAHPLASSISNLAHPLNLTPSTLTSLTHPLTTSISSITEPFSSALNSSTTLSNLQSMISRMPGLHLVRNANGHLELVGQSIEIPEENIIGQAVPTNAPPVAQALPVSRVASIISEVVKQNDACIREIDVKAETICPVGTVDTGRFCETEHTVDPEVSCPAGFLFEGEKCIQKKEVALTLECPPGYELANEKCQRLRIFNANEYCPSGYVFHQGVCVSYLKEPVVLACEKGSQLTAQNACVHVQMAEKQLKCPQGYTLDFNYHKSPIVGEKPALFRKRDDASRKNNDEVEVDESVNVSDAVCIRRIETAAVSTCPVDTVMRGSDCVRTETIDTAESCDIGFEFHRDTNRCLKKDIRQPKFVCPNTHKLVNKFCVRKKVSTDGMKLLRN